MQTEAVDYEAIKERQRMGWEAGDYPRIGNTLHVARQFNGADDGTVLAPGEYLEAVGVRR
jgi:hypothetical protein